MATRAMRYVEEAAPSSQHVEDVHIEGLPTAGAALTAGSVTNEMLAGGISADKLAAGVIPEVPASPGAASASAAGLVKMAAAVPDAAADADAAALAATLNALLASLRASGALAQS